MSEFDIRWPHGWQTRAGLSARLLAEVANPKWPFVFVVGQEGGDEAAFWYNREGKCAQCVGIQHDLINIPLPAMDGDEHLKDALQKAEDDLDRVTRESNEFRRQRDEAFEALSKYASTLDDMGIALEASVIKIKEGGSNG